MKQPAFQFYPGDWMKDPELRACSAAARGVWMDLICLMSESRRRGYLEINGRAMNPGQVARATGCEPVETVAILLELKEAGVYSIEEGTGIIYCRRMARAESESESIREERREAGKRGAAARWQTDGKGYGKEHGKPMANHGSSSSPSSSTNDDPPKSPIDTNEGSAEDALRKFGVYGQPLDDLVADGRLTHARVVEVWDKVQANAKVRKPQAVLIAQLRSELGIRAPPRGVSAIADPIARNLTRLRIARGTA